MAESVITGFNLQSFQAQLGNVALSNNFVANITLPTALQALSTYDPDRFRQKIPFALQATEAPGSEIGEITIPFRGGTKFRIPGDRDFTSTWSCTARFDVDSVIYDSFTAWSDAIVGYVEADTAFSDDDVLQMMGVGELYQLSRNSRILKYWSIANIWIKSIGSISYEWSNDNAVVNVPLTFVMSHHENNVTRNNTISETLADSGSLVF